IWAQDLLPLFVVLTIGTGLLGFIEGKRWAQLLHLPVLAITGQIHYVAFVLIPVTLFLLIVGRRRLTRSFLISFAVVILLVLPYAIGAIQASLLNPATLNKILSGQKGGPAVDQPSGNAIEFAIFTVAGTNLHSLAGPQEFQNYLNSVPEDIYRLFNIYALAILVAAAWLIIRSIRFRDGRTPVDVTLLLWFLFTPLIFMIPWTPAYPHYMIPIFPAAYLIFGVGISDFWPALAKRKKPGPFDKIALSINQVADTVVVLVIAG